MPDRPLSRQPVCGQRSHEEHIWFPCDWCLCGAHDPPGIYPETESARF